MLLVNVLPSSPDSDYPDRLYARWDRQSHASSPPCTLDRWWNSSLPDLCRPLPSSHSPARLDVLPWSVEKHDQTAGRESNIGGVASVAFIAARMLIESYPSLNNAVLTAKQRCDGVADLSPAHALRSGSSDASARLTMKGSKPLPLTAQLASYPSDPVTLGNERRTGWKGVQPVSPFSSVSATNAHGGNLFAAGPHWTNALRKCSLICQAQIVTRKTVKSDCHFHRVWPITSRVPVALVKKKSARSAQVPRRVS